MSNPIRKRNVVNFQQNEKSDNNSPAWNKSSVANDNTNGDKYHPVDEDNDETTKGHPRVVTTTTITNASTATSTLATTTATTKIQKWLEGYTSFVDSALNQDKVLKLIQWSLWMLSRYYSPKNSERQKALLDLSYQVSWTRYVTRFLGLPAALEGVLSGSWGDPKTLGKALAWTMVFYYPFEHLAYLQWKTPNLCFPPAPPSSTSSSSPMRDTNTTTTYNNKSNNRKAWWKTLNHNGRLAEQSSAWSCRFWVAYIALDILRSMLALSNINATATTTTATTILSKKDVQLEQLQIVRNLCFALPAIHWSLPNWDIQPWLPTDWVNGLMWLESVVCMYQAIVRKLPTPSASPPTTESTLNDNINTEDDNKEM